MEYSNIDHLDVIVATGLVEKNKVFAAAWVTALPQLEDRQRAVAALSAELEKKSAYAARDWIFRFAPEDRKEAVSSVFEALKKSDLDSAALFLLNLAPKERVNHLYEMGRILTERGASLMKFSPPVEFDTWANHLGKGDEQDYATGGKARGVGDIDRARSIAMSITSEPIKEMTLTDLAFSYLGAKSFKPDKALKVVLELPPGAAQDQLIERIAAKQKELDAPAVPLRQRFAPFIEGLRRVSSLSYDKPERKAANRNQPALGDGPLDEGQSQDGI